MPKTIVFCADGTWNSPGPEDATGAHDAETCDKDQPGCEPQLTNVCKLFGWLQGDLSAPWGSAEMEKVCKDASGAVVQVGKYIHGVGDSKQLLDKVNGGAFGIGVTARIARGYTYLSRNYEKGDRIVIVGFSRGAYTARALAGLVAGEGLLAPALATDPGDKYDNAVAAWLRYRHKNQTLLQRLVEAATSPLQTISDAFGRGAKLGDDDFVPVDAIAAVAVWDTVGSLGIPAYNVKGERIDLFQFCNTKLSEKVGLGLHAVSLDEQRDLFLPTLWDDAPNVTQALFAGGHCDVGGGYPEHALSDVPLLWFVDRLQQNDVGLKFALQPPTAVTPDPLAGSHREWANPLWRALGAHPRQFRASIVVNDSVRQRMSGKSDLVVPPLTPGGPYAPVNLPK